MNLYIAAYMLVSLDNYDVVGAATVFADNQDIARDTVYDFLKSKNPDMEIWIGDINLVTSDVILTAAKNYGIIA